MNADREKKAIHAYLKLLENKGAKSGVLYKRSLFLDQFSHLLAAKALNRMSYGIALDDLMKTIPADKWNDSLVTAREFYPFWMGDIKVIASLNAKSKFDFQPINWKPPQTSIETLTKNLYEEKFNTDETSTLIAYTKALQNKDANDVIIETRVNLAKILLLQLRDAPNPDSRIYRKAVDLTLPLFKIGETQKLFLLVIREFYYFWIESKQPSENAIQVTWEE